MTQAAHDNHDQSYMGSKFFIETFTGRRFYFDEIEKNDINIVDIAHAVANNCRYTGHTRKFYSVAEHCVHASHKVAPAHALAALLHDASEAYLHDVPSPLKWWLAEKGFTAFQDLDKQIEAAIFNRFNVQIDDAVMAAVKEADRRMLSTEQHFLMPTKMWPGCLEPYPDLDLSHPLSPLLAQDVFLERFWELTGYSAPLPSVELKKDVRKLDVV